MGSQASSGDYSDFQTVSEILEEEWLHKRVYGKAKQADPEEFAQYLAALCYAKRNKADPFYFESVLAGVKNGKKSLHYVDLYGNKFSDRYITTSFARMMAPPIIDAKYNEEMSAKDAKLLAYECFRAIIARYKLSVPTLTFVLVTEEGVTEDAVNVQVKFDYEGWVHKEDFRG